MTTFDDASISRRTFVRLSAATGAALSVPGNATADSTSASFDADYEYVLNHTPADYAVPTLVRFSDASGFEAFRSISGDAALTTGTPRAAGYAQLTTAQALAVAELPTAETLSHSPGSNPFWRLGYYPLGVFPQPHRATDFIDFEQMIDGLQHLESEHQDRLDVYSIGQSPGHYNHVSASDDPKGVWVAEVTNDVNDEESFREKEKVFYSLSLHGLERAGAEAGSRFIEQLLRGTETETEQLLDDVVLVFCYTNPDGWVAKHPQYDSGWQVMNPDGVPVAPFYERGNAEVGDTNRQYPTVGYITTDHYPGEPDDPADRSLEKVTDAMAIVDHFRDYENLDYGADLHGMLNAPQFVLGLISQDQFDTRDLHELYEMNRVIDAVLEEELENWGQAADLQEGVTGDSNPAAVLPETAYDYSTIWDTIGYTVSGAMGDWMAHPEELGGLGMTTMDFEMAYSHMVGANVYDPELVRMQVTGYQTAIRTIAEYAVENSDTPGTSDEFDAYTETGDGATASVAYVTTGEPGTDEDALRRHDGQLEFATYEDLEDGGFTFTGVIGPGAEYAGVVQTQEHAVTAPDGAERIDATLSWGANVQDNDFFLENAEGDRIAGSTNFGGPEQVGAAVEPGAEYTLVVETWANAAARYEIQGNFQEAVPREEGSTTATTSSTTEEVAAGGIAVATHQVEQGDLHSLSAHVHAERALFETELVSPSGAVVESFAPSGAGPVGGRCCSHPEWVVSEPETGTWTVRVRSLLGQPETVGIRFGTLGHEGPHPDPVSALGYEQRSYDVTPFRFFEEYGAFTTDEITVDWVTTGAVADGALIDGGDLAYEHVVVIHDRVNPPATDDETDGGGDAPGRSGDAPGKSGEAPGRSDGSDDPRVDRDAYLAAMDEYVDRGGNLVLTDTGVRLLSGLTNDLVSDVGTEALADRTFELAHLGEKDLEHPLLTDVRPIQKALWKVAPLGYKVAGEGHMTLVAEDTFTEEAGGTPSVAATTGGEVSLGSITRGKGDGSGVHVVGGLLPPATQQNLHPFGLLDYTTSFLGYLLFTSVLGFEQVRVVGDEETQFGRGDEWSV